MDSRRVEMKKAASVMRASTSVRSFPTKLVRGGTRYMPSSKEVMATGPSTSTIMAASLWGNSDAVVARTTEEVRSFPSITFLQGCVDDKTALVFWQKNLIEEKGLIEFRRICNERAGAGTSFHKTAAALISQLAGGKLPSQSLEQALEQAKPAARGYVQSIYPFLAELSLDADSLLVEKKAVHHELMFAGRFDAVFKYKGAPCLVDWKTAQNTSAVAKNMRESDDLSGLYGYPRQLAAYVAAFNSDPNYAHMEKIKHAAVVLAYDNGAPAKVVEVNTNRLEATYSELLNQIDQFWRTVERGADEVDMISR